MSSPFTILEPEARGEITADFSPSRRSPVPLIAGCGLRTPLGNSAAETWSRLLAGEFILDHGRVDERSSGDGPRVLHLARGAADEAIAASGASLDELAGPETAIVIGTSKGPVDWWLARPPASRGEARAVAESPGAWGLSLMACLADRYGFEGPRLTLSAACASGLHALSRGAMLIRCREARRVLVVAAESSLHPLFFANFRRLGVLAPPGEGCRPFDRGRQGFVMSEAAAAVLLEAREPADAEDDATSDGSRNRPVIVERFGLAGDATHLTGTDPGGAVLGRLLDDVLDGRAVDLVHAHGTGTVLNDEVELHALERSIGAIVRSGREDRPALYSHKGAMGHTLGASGLVSVVINAMCHAEGIVPPNARTRDPMATRPVSIAEASVRREVSRSIAIAAGFGGATAVVSLASQ